ncbi:hypothetical protein AVEN_222506-1 [Araneus ventricosus]|uniref:STPR domain-containing protein n=1 Tax=Araneus ventricosus TaxID=182803 RepID=A0A4Y1ZTP1_ARAVE|nr:hypothetical protein AVEN_3287-1 [Araneus ventricosus]GBL67642.1 hypothetical protein AVEN_35987-1 [Araneus ventricosus]GBL67782.1 hypothetical protein AVEN_211695-1 [Araneus ventricosus]GBL67806.1 hypothetical protein AVEN_222506-1 [Araneus ventricosus]
MAQRGQERRAEETEEQRNSRLAVMAQRGQRRRAEETDKQRDSRLSAMLKHARERRLNIIEGQNHHQIQTFYAARTVLNRRTQLWRSGQSLSEMRRVVFPG